MSLATFSQTGTNKKVHCFPDSVAKQIAIDLVRGDSAKVELAKTNILVNQLEEKTKTNDRLVTMYVNKVSNYASQIDLYRKKETEYHTIVFGLEKDIVRVKKANKYFRIAVSGLLVTTVLGFTIR
jgi:uncharacterized alpha/beta hydrolase family protein